MAIRMISWNVNGLRACLQKGFMDYFFITDADIFCIQETKLQDGQLAMELNGYEQIWNHARRKGYSGTAVFSRTKPLDVCFGIGLEPFDQEGRVISLEYRDFFLLNVYSVNSQRELMRLKERMEWEDGLLAHVQRLEAIKPVILCGDLNVAHGEIDLKNPNSNRKNAGFTDEERSRLSRLLAAGYTDTFRYFHPDATGAYTWWSYMFNAREKNAGWRIDYFLASDQLIPRLSRAAIHAEVGGSDHCPVLLELE
ncbi:MAG TPA: exodeoxyribonuclease III [Clostridiales bacterium]|nr:exodeoxyribonuclease III [Clostridiales bacterium]